MHSNVTSKIVVGFTLHGQPCTWYLGPCKSASKWHLDRLSLFAGLTVVTNMQTHTHTNRPHYVQTSVVIAHIHALSACDAG